MSTYNIYMKTSLYICFLELSEEFELTVVANEPSVFELLGFDCSYLPRLLCNMVIWLYGYMVIWLKTVGRVASDLGLHCLLRSIVPSKVYMTATMRLYIANIMAHNADHDQTSNVDMGLNLVWEDK